MQKYFSGNDIKRIENLLIFRCKYLCECVERNIFQETMSNKNNLIVSCERKQAKQPFMLHVGCLFSAGNFHKLPKVSGAPSPCYSYNKINLHNSNFLQRHFFPLCQEGVGRMELTRLMFV